MRCTYQQIEAIRDRAAEMGFVANWHGERSEDEAWLRVSRGVAEIAMCFFPSRLPLLSVEASDPLELAHRAIEVVAIYSTLTAGLHDVRPVLMEVIDAQRESHDPCSGCLFDEGGCAWGLRGLDATMCSKALSPEAAP